MDTSHLGKPKWVSLKLPIQVDLESLGSFPQVANIYYIQYMNVDIMCTYHIISHNIYIYTYDV
jgi:hypothetical protein